MRSTDTDPEREAALDEGIENGFVEQRGDGDDREVRLTVPGLVFSTLCAIFDVEESACADATDMLLDFLADNGFEVAKTHLTRADLTDDDRRVMTAIQYGATGLVAIKEETGLSVGQIRAIMRRLRLLDLVGKISRVGQVMESLRQGKEAEQ